MTLIREHVTVLHLIVHDAPDLSPASRDKYERDLDAWVDFAGPDPSGWTRKKAQAFYNGLIVKIRPQSANRLMSSIAYASKWWAHREGNPDLDFAHVQKSKSQGKEVRHALDRELALMLLETTKGGFPADLRDRAMIIVGLETGMRRMSLSGMRWERIYLDPYPRIEVPIKGRGKDLYSVPLSDACIAALSPWQTWLKATKGPVFCRLKPGIVRSGKTLVAGKDGLSGAGIFHIVQTRAARAGIENMHPHLFRHTFVTWRTELGATDHEIASVTGHTVTSSGALGGYKDLMQIGARARMQTPDWLLDWVRGAR